MAEIKAGFDLSDVLPFPRGEIIQTADILSPGGQRSCDRRSNESRLSCDQIVCHLGLLPLLLNGYCKKICSSRDPFLHWPLAARRLNSRFCKGDKPCCLILYNSAL